MFGFTNNFRIWLTAQHLWHFVWFTISSSLRLYDSFMCSSCVYQTLLCAVWREFFAGNKILVNNYVKTQFLHVRPPVVHIPRLQCELKLFPPKEVPLQHQAQVKPRWNHSKVRYPLALWYQSCRPTEIQNKGDYNVEPCPETQVVYTWSNVVTRQSMAIA